MKIILSMEDKEFAKNKEVKTWLKKCEKIINKELENSMLELQAIGSLVINM